MASGWREQSVVIGKAREQELEAAGHTICTVRKQRQVLVLSPPFSSLLGSGPWPTVQCYLQLGSGFLPQLTDSSNSTAVVCLQDASMSYPDDGQDHTQQWLQGSF